jgi:hypothetical protein
MLADRRIVVTGAARGLGRALAIAGATARRPVRPDEPAWSADGGRRPTNRDIGAAALFALQTPDRAPIDTIVTAQGAWHDEFVP